MSFIDLWLIIGILFLMRCVSLAFESFESFESSVDIKVTIPAVI